MRLFPEFFQSSALLQFLAETKRFLSIEGYLRFFGTAICRRNLPFQTESAAIFLKQRNQFKLKRPETAQVGTRFTTLKVHKNRSFKFAKRYYCYQIYSTWKSPEEHPLDWKHFSQLETSRNWFWNKCFSNIFTEKSGKCKLFSKSNSVMKLKGMHFDQTKFLLKKSRTLLKNECLFQDYAENSHQFDRTKKWAFWLCERTFLRKLQIYSAK